MSPSHLPEIILSAGGPAAGQFSLSHSPDQLDADHLWHFNNGIVGTVLCLNLNSPENIVISAGQSCANVPWLMLPSSFQFKVASHSQRRSVTLNISISACLKCSLSVTGRLCTLHAELCTAQVPAWASCQLPRVQLQGDSHTFGFQYQHSLCLQQWWGHMRQRPRVLSPPNQHL